MYTPRHIRLGAGVAVLILLGGFLYAFAAPRNFPSGAIITIEPGASAAEAAEALAEAGVISHPLVLRLVLRFSGAHDSVQPGAYRFEKPQNLLTVARRLTLGEHDLPPVRITFPEGSSVREMAARIEAAFPHIAAPAFVALAKKDEGYLFPDTYHFPQSADAEIIVSTLRENFDAKLAALLPDVTASGRTLSDIIVMASIVEKEARTLPNKRLVAGVLWNRLDLDMPLQVDAVFGYIFDRDTYHPSTADLKVDSPYNTYLYRGLPPGAINNPGLESIDAALHPTPTDYLFYLTGSDDRMHYARTYAEHQANLRNYLK